ncbi:MAG TPA: CoA pyrophosphatase [Actinomycetales bacterium]
MTPQGLRERLAAVPALAAAAPGDQGPLAFTRARPAGTTTRRSAVLITFSDGHGAGGPDVLLTERASTLRSHAGQVSFPGGGVDADDDGPVGAALREAHEETGLPPDAVEVLGALPDLPLPVSSHLVTPVLAWWWRPAPVGPVDAAEVAAVVRAPVDELVDPANRFTNRHPSGYVGPGFRVRGLYVWGFTAGLLSHVLQLAGLERPWDDTRPEPLPDDVRAMLRP